MKAELIAFLMLSLMFSIGVMSAVEREFADDKNTGYGIFGREQTQTKDVSEYSDLTMNDTMHEYGFDQSPTNLVSTFNPLGVGILSSVKFLWDFLFNMLYDTGTTILSFFPQTPPEFILAVGGLIFVVVLVFIAYFIRGRA